MTGNNLVNMILPQQLGLEVLGHEMPANEQDQPDRSKTSREAGQYFCLTEIMNR